MCKIIGVNSGSENGSYPWNADSASITLTFKGKKVDNWQIYNEKMSGKMPFSRTNGRSNGPEDEMSLIP